MTAQSNHRRSNLAEGPRYIDLWEALEAREVAAPRVSYDLTKYRQEERDLLTPALEEAGYTVEGDWFDGERDSFGPLTRCVHVVDPYGTEGVAIYG